MLLSKVLTSSDDNILHISRDLFADSAIERIEALLASNNTSVRALLTSGINSHKVFMPLKIRTSTSLLFAMPRLNSSSNLPTWALISCNLVSISTTFRPEKGIFSFSEKLFKEDITFETLNRREKYVKTNPENDLLEEVSGKTLPTST
jgi:hypothetical protein